MYQPKPAPIGSDPAALSRYVGEELQSVARAQSDALDFVMLNVLNVAPKKPRNGMVVLADGVNWNPSAGAGIYARIAGAWVKL